MFWKYEKGVGVISQDVVDFPPKKDYALILCISTNVHMGWDSYDEAKDPDKTVRASGKLRGFIICKSGVRMYNRKYDSNYQP